MFCNLTWRSCPPSLVIFFEPQPSSLIKVKKARKWSPLVGQLSNHTTPPLAPECRVDRPPVRFRTARITGRFCNPARVGWEWTALSGCVCNFYSAPSPVGTKPPPVVFVIFFLVQSELEPWCHMPVTNHRSSPNVESSKSMSVLSFLLS